MVTEVLTFELGSVAPTPHRDLSEWGDRYRLLGGKTRVTSSTDRRSYLFLSVQMFHDKLSQFIH